MVIATAANDTADDNDKVSVCNDNGGSDRDGDDDKND